MELWLLTVVGGTVVIQWLLVSTVVAGGILVIDCSTIVSGTVIFDCSVIVALWLLIVQ